MDKTSRAIVDYDGKYVFIHRKKIVDGVLKEYYCVPGGHLEENETFEEACIREVKEELGVDVKINSLLLELENEDINTLEKYYLVSILSGKIGTGKGEEFTTRDFEKYGSYEIAYIDKKDLSSINLLPVELKKLLIN